jgi:uncharacterized membrane protein (UPF0136 family)
MTERHNKLFKLLASFALVGAIVGYLREASFFGTLAGAIFFIVICGVVGLLMTDSRSLVK